MPRSLSSSGSVALSAVATDALETYMGGGGELVQPQKV